jgi:outer membrane receptor protein involved in Fe transport
MWTRILGIAAVMAATGTTARAAPPAEPAVASDLEADDPDEEDGGKGGEVREISVPTRSDGLTASGRTIDADTISTTPKRSAEDLLRLVPGLTIVQHGNQGKAYQFYLRGFDAGHGSDVEILLQDIPLNEASNVHAHGYLDLAFIIPETVESIDARKGSYRLDQGNFGTAGTIQYRLGVPRHQRGTRTVYEIGSTNRHRAAVIVAPRKAADETFVAVEALHDSGYGDNRRSQRISAMSQVRLWHDRGAYVDGLGAVYGARFGLPGTVRSDDVNRGDIGFYDAYLSDTDGESSRALLALRSGLERDKVRVSVTGYGMARRLVLDENFTGDLLFADLGDRHLQRQESIAAGLRARYEHDVHDKVRLQVGAEMQGDVVDQGQDQLTTTGQPWGATRDLDISQLHFGVSPGLRALPVPWMLLEGGARFDVFHYEVVDHLQRDEPFIETFFAASPRIALRLSPGERWSLFLAYGRGLRSPEARAITLPSTPPPDTDLAQFAGGQARMTLTDSTEVGARFVPSDLVEVGATAFGVWIDRESVFDHVSGFNVELSGTQRLGLEGDVQVHPIDWLSFGADITAVRARFTTSGAAIPGAPPLVTSLFGTLVHPKGFRAGLRWFLLGPRPLTYGAKAGVMTVLDLNVGYRYRTVQVDLSVDNSLGLRWREGEYNFASHWDPTRPRSQIPTIHYVAGYPLTARLGLTAWF